MRIPIELNPFEDEIFSSWLIRNAIANGTDAGSFADGIWPNYRTWTRDIDRHIPDDKIDILCKRISLSKEHIRNLTLEPLIEKIMLNGSLNPKKSWYFVIPTGLRGGLKTNGTYFCPYCLDSKNPYFKKQWRLAWNTSCPIHGNLLIAKCQKCNRNIEPHLITYTNSSFQLCTHCGFDLRKSKCSPENTDVTAFQEQLNNCIFNNSFDARFPIINNTHNELFITIRNMLSLLKMLMQTPMYYDIFDKLDISCSNSKFKLEKRIIFESMKAEERQILLLMIVKLFKLNIKEIRDLLEEYNITYKSLMQLKTTNKTMSYLSKNLSINNIYMCRENIKHPIQPRTKIEVDKIIDNIKRFL
ncbi:MAG: TniQ family protein [Sulfurovaceae bacterium]